MKICVIGAGKSGTSAAILAKKNGNEVFLTEFSLQDKFISSISQLNENSIEYEFGTHSFDKILSSDLVITSPGIPPSSKIIQEIEAKGIRIISELEFAFTFLNGQKIIAITGTNGKTTVTSLISFIFQEAGKKVITVGNIGIPLSELVLDIDLDTYVIVEVSSFQLDRIEKFRPDVAIILNVTPDHIYYHGTFQQYFDAKWKITLNQNKENLLILGRDDDEICSQYLLGDKTTDAEVAFFTQEFSTEVAEMPSNWGIWVENSSIIINNAQHKRKEELMNLQELALPGVHNLYNSMASALAARYLEISKEDIRDAMMRFQGVEHRMEFVANIAGVSYINDSKATNVNATWYALSSYTRPLIWIAGGQGKGNNYSSLDALVRKNVKSIMAIGDEADNIFNHFASTTRVQRCKSLEEAVQLAQKEATENDMVLFTPACKSFDMFANFEHRGEVFKEIVKSLEKEVRTLLG